MISALVSTRYLSWAFLLLALSTTRLPADEKEKTDPPPREPELISLSPLSASAGTTLQASLRGRSLEGTHAVWFNTDQLKGWVKKVEEIDLDEGKEKEEENEAEPATVRLGHRILLRIEIDPKAERGAYSLRLVSQRGISTALTFWVDSEAVVAESAAPHAAPRDAQPIDIPVVVTGQLSRAKELDWYLFEALQGQQLIFEMSGAGKGGKPELYELTGSWFQPDRVARLSFDMEHRPRHVYSFTRKGRYLVKVTGNGGADSSYRLRIAGADDGASYPNASSWHERLFTRKLEPERLQQLWARTLPAPSKGAAPYASSNGSTRKAVGPEREDNPVSTASSLPILSEQEPNETSSQALDISIPAIVEGVIERAGDVDTFRFTLKGQQALAFEIETPQIAPLRFSPRLGVLDAEGKEILTNIYKRIPSQTNNYWITTEAKTIYSFNQAGEYFLQMRDITLRNGSPGFRYRLLIRPQIPHVGRAEVAETLHRIERHGARGKDRINLVPGAVERLTVITHNEEGFPGDIAIQLENLPPGVEVISGTEVEPEGGAGKAKDPGRRERFVPRTQKATILLVAKENAPATSGPYLIEVRVRPVIWNFVKEGIFGMVDAVREGRMGPSLLVGEIPLMVVGQERTDEQTSKRANELASK